MRTGTIILKNKKIRVYIPEGAKEMALGMDVVDQKADTGMLFTFPTSRAVPIRKSNDILDVLWLYDNRVMSMLTIYDGTVAGVGDMVLELPPGWIVENDVRRGDMVEILDGTSEKTAQTAAE